MAENNYIDDEMDEEREDEQAEGLSAKKKILLMAGLAVLLVGVSIGGTLLAVKLLSPAPVEEVSAEGDLDAQAEAAAEANEATLTEQSEGQAATEAKAKKPAIYYPIKPPLIVNFDSRGRQRFLQAELALMTRDDDVIQAIELHMSQIRNNLLLLIGSHLYEELQTAEGKEILRQQCLQEMQRVMEQEIGKPGIEQVLFTNFVMQ
jgi:flagellar FliL protein